MRPIDPELAEAGLPTMRRAASIEVDTDQLTCNALALTDRVATFRICPPDGLVEGLPVVSGFLILGRG